MKQTASTLASSFGNFPFGKYTSRKNPRWKQQMQQQLLNDLKTNVSSSGGALPIKWDKEYPLYQDSRDRADICGNCLPDFQVIIEIDASRADQIAKKIVSRFPSAIGRKTIYVCIIYPRQDSSSKKECDKYCEYGKILLKNIDPHNEFIQVTIDNSGNVTSRIL